MSKGRDKAILLTGVLLVQKNILYNHFSYVIVCVTVFQILRVVGSVSYVYKKKLGERIHSRNEIWWLKASSFEMGDF